MKFRDLKKILKTDRHSALEVSSWDIFFVDNNQLRRDNYNPNTGNGNERFATYRELKAHLRFYSKKGQLVFDELPF